jgi:PPOX class probable F420-dependent enzyme
MANFDRAAFPGVLAFASLGGVLMAKQIPANFMDLVNNKKAFAQLATLMPDGTPQVTPVWFDMAGDRIRVNTARGRVKERNMTKNPAVAISISDPENPYRHASMRGRVVKSTEEGADAHIDSLSKKYLGKDSYPMRNPAEKRVIFEIELISVNAMG